MIQISNTTEKVAEDFRAFEFYTKDPSFTGTHVFDERLITAVQYLRSLFGLPIRINSTYRSKEYNELIGSTARNSYHIYGQAVDFEFITKANKQLIAVVELSVLNKGKIKKDLQEIGVQGFLFYENFIHFDTRLNFFTKRYQ